MTDVLPVAERRASVVDGGEMARRIAAHDWASTAVGPIDQWPHSMRTAIALMLRSKVAIVMLFGDAGVMIYNDAYAFFAGGRHPQLLGTNVREGWPEVADFNDHVMKVGLAGGTLAYRDQQLTLNREGHPEQVWMDLDCSPIPDDAGEPGGVMAIVVETTDRMLARTWLAGEQERLRRMFEQAPGFMAMTHGPEHVFDFVNDSYLALTGRRELQGKRIRDVLPDLEGQGVFEMLDRVYETGVPASGVAQPIRLLRTPDGPLEERFVDFVYQPVRGESGDVVAIFTQGNDVTERMQAQARAAAIDARNRQILDSAVDYAIIATETDGTVTLWNEGAHRIFGWTEDEMKGGDLERMFTPEDRAIGRMQAERRCALDEGRAGDERWHLRQTGERFFADGEMVPLRDELGRAVGLVKVMRDATERHRAAQALERSEQELRRAQQAGGVGMFTLALDADVIDGTSEFWRIFGLPDSKAMPAPQVQALVVEDDRAVASDAARRRSASAALDVEYRIRRANDGALRVIARRSEYEYEDGRPVRMVGVVQDVTDQRVVQRALEESEQRFRTLTQAMPNQVWTATADGTIDWANERVYEYTGSSAEALDGEGWMRTLHDDDAPDVRARWAGSLATGAVFEAEFRLRRRDGAYRWHLARALPLPGTDGAVARWIGTNTDIDEQKRAEAENARDRDRLWTLSQDLMLVCDLDGRITAVNPTAQRVLGWSAGEMIGRTVSEFVHPDDLASTAAELGRLARGEKTLAFENRYATRDGGYRLLDWSAVPDKDRIHAVGRDITESRAIASDQARIWALSPVLKVVSSPGGTIAKVNPAWTQTLGWSQDETIGRELIDFVGRDDTEARAGLRRVAAGEVVRDFEMAVLAKDGISRRVTWSFVLENECLFGFGRDVTDQRNAEEALRQSQKMEAVGQLTGGIAHDFNNLLQGITGSLDLVQKRVAQGRWTELDRYIGGAMTSAKRASALTHRLLAFSRRQPLDPRPVQANPLVTSMEDLLRRTLGERVQLELVTGGGLWLTKCDPNQLESAILNLAINARDAMPDGGKLVIETSNAHLDSRYAARQRDVKPGQYVCIAVTDTGTGMSQDTLARAFEPFFTTKPIGQGTGLGLSMIYGFAMQSEGFARIYSEVGQGTTVKLYLPRHRGSAHTDEASPPPAEAPVTERGETVLVVEDEPVVRALILDVLRDLGYRTLEAADGNDGLKVLQSPRRVDLLVTDVGLPGLNGRQVADAARTLRPGLKVLFMTGYAENAALAAGFLEPGMAMITKPFSMEALVMRIGEMTTGA